MQPVALGKPCGNLGFVAAHRSNPQLTEGVRPSLQVLPTSVRQHAAMPSHCALCVKQTSQLVAATLPHVPHPSESSRRATRPEAHLESFASALLPAEPLQSGRDAEKSCEFPKRLRVGKPVRQHLHLLGDLITTTSACGGQY